MAAAAALASVLSLTLAAGAAAVAELVMGAEMDYRGLMGTGLSKESKIPQRIVRRSTGNSRVEEFGQNPELGGTPFGSGYCQLNRQAPSGYKTEVKANGLVGEI